MSLLRRLTSAALAATLLVSSGAGPSQAQGRGESLNLISDAEIQHTIRTFAEPIFTAAGLSTESVQVHIVNNRSLNAFVAGGQRIFIFTGLLTDADTPEQIMGVIAHETGHIAGGHLVRVQEAMRAATSQSVIGMLIGAAAIAGGGGGSSGNAGVGVLAGGAQMGQQSLLQYSRTQEAVADQAGLKFLTEAGVTGRGLLEVMRKLSSQEALLPESQDPYVRSHRLTRDRIQSLQTQVETSSYRDTPSRPEDVVAFQRMKAKLIGFLTPEKVAKDYPASDTSVPARYARAIAYHRGARIDLALQELNGLIAESPGDPFFQELKGQILYEAGRSAEAIEPYRRSVELLPQEPLLRLGLAQAEIALNDQAMNRDAIQHLEIATRADPDLIDGWRNLAIAYGRDQNFGMSSVASAERALRTGRREEARSHASRAERELPFGSPGYLRAQDILNASRPLPRR